MEKVKHEKPQIRTRKYTKFLVFLCLFVFLFALVRVSVAQAASLYFFPSSGSYEVGKTFSATVYVSSADQAMNAASGVISFPKTQLEVVSLSKTGSIFGLWVQEPSFSNSAGMVNFEGIALNPGFMGASGKLITINFKVKAAGSAALNFSSGSVLANDGQGTNILASLGNAQFSLGGAAPAAPTVPKTTTPPAVSGAPSAPSVSSPTHPDSNKWYAPKDAEFTWAVPAGVNGVSIYFSQSPISNPGSVSDGLFASKSYENIGDGIWYFHIKMRNSAGWGPVAHFKIQIDTQPPEPFEVKFTDGNETDNPKPTVLFDTTDSLSGVDYYKIKIGEGDFFSIAPDIAKSNPYTLPPQAPGKRSILVQAFDGAGNYQTAVEEFEILPIKSPVITEYPEELQSGEPLIVRGSTYPNSQVIIWLQREKDDPKSFTATSDQDGKFTFVADERLGDGIYKLWAEVIDGRGAKSGPSEKVTLVVQKPVAVQIGLKAIDALAVLIPLIALIILLLILLWYGWHKFSLFRKRIIKETKEAEQALHKAIKLLKEDIEDRIKLLEKTKLERQLTKEEDKIMKQLRKDLDDAEKFARKEIEDIEREIK